MCGRFTSRTTGVDLAQWFGVEEIVARDLGARYNIAPTDDTYAVAESGGRRRLGTFRWGLVPFWAKDLKIGARMFNARAEGLLDSTAFRRAFERRRCIIPADGFYEWARHERPPERGTRVSGKRQKQPWYITRADGAPMAFAGLWDTWRSPDVADADADARIRSCTIITGPPNERIAPLHDRMPVVLPHDAWDAWLDRDNDDVASLQGLLVPAPSELFELVPVSTAVNTVTNDGPELVEPVEPVSDTLL